MPTVKTKDIIVGAAHLYITNADAPAALPAAPTAVAPALPASYKTALDGAAGWRYVGATSGGVEVSQSVDTGEVEVDQIKGPALMFNTGQSMSVSTELAEATLANLMIAWGYRSTDLVGAGDTLNLAAMPDSLVERSIALVGNAPMGAATTGKRERVYYGRRVVAVEGGGHTFSRTEATTLPVSFRLLPDTSQAGSEFGTVVDRTIAA